MTCFDRTVAPDEWDAYVQGHPAGTFSHLSGWVESLGRVYRLPRLNLAARAAKPPHRLTGLVSFLRFSPPGGPVRLISLPYTDYAGILADDASTAEALYGEALAAAAEWGVQHLEFRQAAGLTLAPQRCSAGLPAGRTYTFKSAVSMDLPDSADTLWRRFSCKVRNQVRKAGKTGCSARVGKAELLDDFYAVFSENMRDLGSPVHARSLFATLAETMRNRFRFILAYHDCRAVAAAMVFRCGDTLYNPWASSLRAYRPSCANMLLYWSMLAEACETGCRRFDFGRSSPGGPTFRFKMQWGARAQPLAWQVVSRADPPWRPDSESLSIDWWKGVSLDESRRRGPDLRRWISL